jgi:hypothetical protein
LWHIPVVPALGRLRLVDHLSPKIKKKKKKDKEKQKSKL